MKGHSNAETLAFAMLAIANRWGREIGDDEVAPLVVLGAGAGSGELRLLARATRRAPNSATVERPLIEVFAHQLHTAGSVVEAESSKTSRGAAPKLLARAAAAQARFFRALCRGESDDAAPLEFGIASCDLAGDHALYLRVVFPRAKFVFLHRNPLEAFRTALTPTVFPDTGKERDILWAEMFAERWCSSVASFELWRKEVGGVIVGYDEALSEASEKLRAYLGRSLFNGLEDEPMGVVPASFPELHDEEVALITERTGEVAARYGYALSGKRGRSATELNQRIAVTEPRAVHQENTCVSCAVLVPAMRYIEPECDEALAELERHGYTVIRMRGCPSIDQGRNRLATLAIEQGFEETLWIDADTGFEPEVVQRLRSHSLPIVAGLCARKRPGGGLAVAPLPGTRDLLLGEEGGLAEVLYAGTGFTLVRREVYQTMQGRFNLPLCDEDRAHRSIPFFMPMLEDWGGRMSYLGEDYAFSRRARLCGYKIMADTSIRLWHIGPYRYGYEDAGNAVERVASYRHVFESEDGRCM